MKLPHVLVLVLLVVWLAYGGWTTARTYRKGGRQDRGTRLVFVAGIFAPFVIGLLVRGSGIGLPVRAHATALAWTGAAVMLCGIVLWMKAIATLGPYFSVNVDLPEDHRLVDTGVYAHLRHPAYAGMITTELGIGLASADWIVAAVFLVVPAAAFLYRIHVEERALAQHFGDHYRAYARRTRRLVPFVF